MKASLSSTKPMLIDYHLHNHFSPDSKAGSMDLINAERENGVQEICFTNHAEWFESNSVNNKGVFDLEEALRRFESVKWEIELLQKKLPDFPIKFGAEITFNKEITQELDTFIEKMDFDFVLGSIHNIDGKVINSSKSFREFFDGRKEEPTYKKYFQEVLRLVQWGNIDAVAHFDVIKKFGTQYFGQFEPKKYEDLIRTVLRQMAQKGIGLELNTQAIEKACKEIFPHPTILKWALTEGITNFTLSSDAHRAIYAGNHIKLALDIAKEAGITHISTYSKRKATLNEII